MTRTFYIFNHQGKGDEFESTLLKAGYTKTDLLNAQVVLTDIDAPGRIVRMRAQLESRYTKLFCYPHAARPFIGWDGLFPPSEHTSASFVFTEGHIEVIRAYGYKKPLHAVGWLYCPITPFTPCTEVRRVLFAPIHPNANGFLSTLDKQINHDTYAALLRLVQTEKIDLTVRHLQSLASGGLWQDKRVRYVPGYRNTNQINDIADADLVVSHQTFAFMAVASGKPTLMMAEFQAPRNGGDPQSFQCVRSWEKYRQLLAYPLDILNTPDVCATTPHTTHAP